jgi:hypothetical protein
MTKKIGIVIHANAMLFSNGITQNAYFLYQCLTHCGYICQFLCHEANPAPFQYEKIPLQQIVCNNPLIFNPDDFSLILTVSRNISKEQYTMFREKRIRVIGIVCGNHFMQDQETFLFSRNSGSFYGKEDACDELWTIPCYKHSHVYLQTLRKVPVYAIPHLWHPCILQKRALHLSKAAESDMMYTITKHPGKQIDIVIMEPNISLFKNAWLPIIACEYLHMNYPELINNVYVFNYPDNSCSYPMIQTLSLGSKLRPFKRLEMDEVIVYFANQSNVPIFLSYQVNNALNYLYYELLYYGYPLVHNSDMMDGCGYYYKNADIEMCANSILYAFKHHNKSLLKYKSDGMAYLERVNPFNADVCTQIQEKIKSVLV